MKQDIYGSFSQKVCQVSYAITINILNNYYKRPFSTIDVPEVNHKRPQILILVLDGMSD
ncbi:hypothetical protein SFSGTM_32740 (plasmid) [Sulfuriferula nivalis]|uniref:Uncharacterized protein n=1 Tax=Sulfuriferula nivalis TaxID=2675298 RepID=A0A809RLY6_9PROT|nr:hypothetical protein SFSGTM_32740 [Sulfuriferula nivalis]